MIRNFLVTAWRSLSRHLSFTAITVTGLALGMSACLLIMTFVWDQARYDDFHAAGDRIYRILTDRTAPRSDVSHLAASPAPLADELRRQVPGIEATARIAQIRTLGIVDGKGVAVTGLYAEPSFFRLFDFEVVGGDGRAILDQPYRLILSQQAAVDLFGTEDPIGKTVQLEGHGDFVVAGLLRPPAGRSHLKFDMLASFVTQELNGRSEELADWDNSWRFATYMLVADPQAVERLEAVLPGIARLHYAGKEERLAFRVQALNDIALGPPLGNEISSYSMPGMVVYFLAGLGLLIMLAAGFNYVGLSVARAMRRASEVGVRKSMGASRMQVVTQFLSEAVLLALFALVVGYLFLLWLVPSFNGLTLIQMGRAEITLSRLADARLLGIFVVFALLVGVTAGLYPALKLSRYSPVQVLKRLKTVKGFSGRFIRFGLIGIQFGLALFFVVTTGFLVAQADHLRTADYGFDPANVLNVDLQGQSVDVLRAELSRNPAVLGVSAASKLPASGSTARVEVRTPGGDEPEDLFLYAVDPAFRDNLGLRLLAGRDFSDEYPTDRTASVVLNETALEALDLGTPVEAVGRFIGVGDPPTDLEVIGVVEDYHYNTMLDPIAGMMWRYDPAAFRYLNVRVRPGTMDDVEAAVASIWSRVDGTHPVSYERFENQLADGPLNRVFGDFVGVIALMAALAIVVSCLGILGMAAYATESRVKEVGLRKALGSSRAGVVLLLSRSFLKLVIVGAVVTLPLAWLVNRAWLELFASRVTLSPWIFAAATLFSALLALGATVTQTMRAASVNPVESLRYE